MATHMQRLTMRSRTELLSGQRGYVDVPTVYIWAGALKSRLPLLVSAPAFLCFWALTRGWLKILGIYFRSQNPRQPRRRPASVFRPATQFLQPNHPEILGLQRLALLGNTCLHPSPNTRRILLALWNHEPNHGDSSNFQTSWRSSDPKSSRLTTTKRDSLAVELGTGGSRLATGTDVHLGLLAAQATTSDLKTKQHEKELLIERLEQDRRNFAHREMGNVKRRNGIRPRYVSLLLPTCAEANKNTSVSVHQRTAELVSLESQNAQSFKLVQSLKAKVREAKEDATRIDLRLMLVERDVGYLQALLETAWENWRAAASQSVPSTSVQKATQNGGLTQRMVKLSVCSKERASLFIYDFVASTTTAIPFFTNPPTV
ncbi:hypothetical protein BKA70DRAFT_1408248 [Coprinopsis sp. MPI-PUGE-AT-0042]|nr:hypothetical protein BKA70DRAFT_1408248 [Coprinopsis sp. MPI-PUGE-AT-0042]